MYNKSPRMGRLIKGETPDNVGPTTYQIDDCLVPREGYVPFLSCKSRNFAIGLPVYTEAQYAAFGLKPKVKGGDIPRAARFSSAGQGIDGSGLLLEDTGPGPGTYDPKIPSKKCPFIDPTPIPGKGRLYVCKPPRRKTCPTIPSRIDEAYNLDEDGLPVPIPPREYDTTLGPAFYNVSTQPCWTTRRYKGCRWSKRRSKRKTFEGNNNPSPLDYDICLDCCKPNPNDERFREMARLFTFIPRFAEATEMKTIAEDLPGPAAYFPPYTSLKLKKSLSIRPVPMVSEAKRFKSTGGDSPGPGTYDPLLKKKTSHSIMSSGFNINAPRFSKKKVEASPGPAYYTQRGPLQEKLDRKMNWYSSVDVPFCQTARRKLTFVQDDQYFTPGPAHYPSRSTSAPHPSLAGNGPTFRSKVDRFPKVISDTAEPATYSTNGAYNANKNHRSHNIGDAPFNQTNPRPPLFGKLPDNPAPDKYEVEGGLRDRGLYFNCEFPRFACSKEDIPAPNAYKINARWTDSCFKAYGTHNVKLNESVQRRNKTSPADKEWDTTRRKNKVLRWFVQPSRDYRHCVFVM